jgi:hypothetical protein
MAVAMQCILIPSKRHWGLIVGMHGLCERVQDLFSRL